MNAHYTSTSEPHIKYFPLKHLFIGFPEKKKKKPTTVRN